MGILIYSKPSFLFNVDDSIKQFGIGYQSKTVLPLSIMAILSANEKSTPLVCPPSLSVVSKIYIFSIIYISINY